MLGQTLVIGRRTNVEWYDIKSLYLPEDVTRVAKQRGRLFIPNAVDYFFIAKNAFPWQHVPNVVIARNGYDSFLVMTAIQNNVSVIDATSTLLAVHQTDAEGNFAGGNSLRKYSNQRLINKLFNMSLKHHFHKGYTTAATYETTNLKNKSDEVSVIVIKRHPRLQY